MTGCGAPGPRIDNARIMPGYPKLEGAGCDNEGEKQVNYDKTTPGPIRRLMTAGGSHVPTPQEDYNNTFHV